VWLVGGVVRVLAAGGGVVGDSMCGAGASVCGGRWIVAFAVCRTYAALSNVTFAARCGRFAGAGSWVFFEGRGDAVRCSVAAVRT
jgi:hypothetical protein